MWAYFIVETHMNIGESVELNCGVILTVVEILGSGNVKVSDGVNSKNVNKSNLLLKKIKWPAIWIIKKDVWYKSKSFGWFTILDIQDYKSVILFEDTQNIEVEVDNASIISGNVSDSLKIQIPKVLLKFPINSIHSMGKFGNIKILEVHSKMCLKIEIIGADEYLFVSVKDIRDRSFTRNSKPTVPEGYYVYIAKIDDSVKYVGMGKNLRYLHCNSGTSHNYALNKLHFSDKSKDMVIEIYKEGLSKEKAALLEIKLIADMEPECNTQRVFK